MTERYYPVRRNGLFGDWFDNMFDTDFGFPMVSTMKADVRSRDGNYLLDIEIPGYKKEDIKVSLYNGNLTVSAEHNETQEEKDARGNVLRQERYMGSVSRTFYVGEGIKDTDVKASYNNGILTLEIPSEEKKEIETKKFIEIA